MLFVSVSPEHTVVIRPDIPAVRVNQHGMTEHYSNRPALYAQFKPKSLDAGQRARADTEFRRRNPQHPYGATPYRDGSVMGSQFADLIDEDNPEPYTGYDPIHQLGKFDSATDINYAGQTLTDSPEERAEIRKLVEQSLLADTSLNGPQGFILLDDVIVEKPWPTYPVEGQGRHAKIAAAVRDMGFDPNHVIAFEATLERPGAGVISEMEKIIAERAGEKSETDALSAVIG